MGQLDLEAAWRRHVAIPQARDRRYNTKLTHYRFRFRSVNCHPSESPRAMT
jgi:hypothetical protein